MRTCCIAAIILFVAGSAAVADKVAVREIKLISANTAGRPANAESRLYRFSLDGRYALFETSATNLGLRGDGGRSYLYIRNIDNGVTTPVVTSSDGTAPDGDVYLHDATPELGVILYGTTATNLSHPASAQGAYLRKRGVRRHIPVSFPGTRTVGGLHLAPDGSAVYAITETAGLRTAYSFDVATRTVVPIATQRKLATGYSNYFFVRAVSGGKVVVVNADALNSDCSTSRGQAVLYDVASKAGKCITKPASGTAANGKVLDVVVGNSGDVVVITSANNLDQLCAAYANVYLYRMVTQSLSCLTKTYDGSRPVGGSSEATISNRGRLVSYWSANWKITDDRQKDGTRFKYVHDTVSGRTIRTILYMNTAYGPSQFAGECHLAFTTWDKIDMSDQNDDYDVHILDVRTGATALASTAVDGAGFGRGSGFELFASGSTLAYSSDANASGERTPPWSDAYRAKVTLPGPTCR